MQRGRFGFNKKPFPSFSPSAFSRLDGRLGFNCNSYWFALLRLEILNFEEFEGLKKGENDKTKQGLKHKKATRGRRENKIKEGGEEKREQIQQVPWIPRVSHEEAQRWNSPEAQMGLDWRPEIPLAELPGAESYFAAHRKCE